MHSAPSLKTQITVAAVSGAIINASVWGFSWFPLKWLAMRGVPALWVTWITFLVCSLVVCVMRPQAAGALWRSRSLWWVMLASGLTNACFNMALSVGDVVRVVLLFYLMPMWVVLLARWLLDERITVMSLLRTALALAGASLVLGEGQLRFPLPQSLIDWLAVIAGFCFGLNNVLLRKHANQPEDARMLAMFAGAALIAPIVLLALTLGGQLPTPAPQASAVLGLVAFAALVLVGNLALQYAAVRLPANVLSVIMLTEILVATLSAWLLGATQLSASLLLGGALIVSASLLAIFTSVNSSNTETSP